MRVLSLTSYSWLVWDGYAGAFFDEFFVVSLGWICRCFL
jgi:hypothetical protein